MARMPARSRSYAPPPHFSREIIQIIADALNEKHGLNIHFTERDAKDLKKAFGFINGLEDSERSRVDARHVAGQLKEIRKASLALEKSLEEIWGLQVNRERVEANLQIADALVSTGKVADHDAAWKKLGNFRQEIEAIRDAAHLAEDSVKKIKAPPGHPRNFAIINFIRLMNAIAKAYGISPKVTTDKEGDKTSGPFIDLVFGFQRFLLESMQSGNRGTWAKRIQRAQKNS